MNRSTKVALPLVLGMTVVVVALLYALIIRPNFYRFSDGTIEFEAVHVARLSRELNEQVLKSGEFLYLASEEGLTKYDLKGNSIWNKSYHMDNLLFLMESPYMCVVDIAGKEAFVFNEDGVTASILTDYQIISASLNTRGYLVLLMEDEAVHYISMYDNEGKLVVERRTIFEQDGYPIKVTTSPDGTKMMTSHLDISDHSVDSNITFLDFSGAGSNFEDRIIGHHRLNDTMASDLIFLDDTHGVVIGDNRLNLFTMDVTPTLVNEIPLDARIEHVAHTGSEVIISYGEATGPEGAEIAGKVAVYSNTGVLIGTHEFEERVTGLYGDQGTYYVILSSKVVQCRSAQKIWETVVYKPVEAIYHIDSDRYLLVFDHDYEVVAIRDL